jgi:hypothetical protein
MVPKDQPQKPTATTSRIMPMPGAAFVVAIHVLTMGWTVTQMATTRRVDSEPAMKLLRWHCSDGR